MTMKAKPQIVPSHPLLSADYSPSVMITTDGTDYSRKDEPCIVQETTFKKSMDFLAESDLSKIIVQRFNLEQAENHAEEDRDIDFKGGRTSDLFKPKCTKEYESAKKKLHSSDLMKKLTFRLGETKIRKRTNDEYDGEWNIDRQWEIKPFQIAKRAPMRIKILEIRADMCFSSGVKSDTINRYGSLIVALCNLLEARGFVVGITLTKANNNFLNSRTHPVNINMINVRIKEPNQYVSVQNLVTAFSSNYYRRALFNHIVAAADALGEDVSYCLGYPIHSDGECVSFDDGVLRIRSLDVLEQPDKLTNAVLAAVNGGN